jgi:adenine-specific DNA-methyltransferase
MRYFGSKVTVIPELYSILSEKKSTGTFCDPFGGIGTIGSYFKSKNYKVTSGDILQFAHFFQISKISLNNVPHFRKLCDSNGFQDYQEVINYLNQTKCRKGWFFKNYVDERKFFTPKNGLKIEACWHQIQSWDKSGLLSHEEKAMLLASLINKMDKVANSAGTYYAYLKKWYHESILPFKFELITPTQGNSYCTCYQTDAKEIVGKQKFDILYLDPPYNERSYSSYYHLPETISLCETPNVHGKSGIPSSERPLSAFNRKGKAKIELENVLNKSRFRLLAFHYTDNGIIPPEDLRSMFQEYGQVEEYSLVAKGYTNKSHCRNVNHRLYVVES